jgi:hypothetical protein
MKAVAIMDILIVIVMKMNMKSLKTLDAHLVKKQQLMVRKILLKLILRK